MGLWRVALQCLFTAQGEALFQTHENLEHLAMMERVLGPLPQHMLKRVEWVIWMRKTKCFFKFIMMKPICLLRGWFVVWPFYIVICFLADMGRNMSGGVDWIGRKVQLQERVLKLFWSYLACRYACVHGWIGLYWSFAPICRIFFTCSNVLAESSNAACGPFGWGSHKSSAGSSKIWPCRSIDSPWSPAASLLYQG